MIHDHSTAKVAFWQFHLGGDRNFCYLLGDPSSGEAAAVDPGFEPQRFHDLARERNLRITHILVTHGHGDHIGGLRTLVDLTRATVHAGSPLTGVATGGGVDAHVLSDGESIAVGDLTVQALATPGHAPDHFCFLCEGSLITGDLLFCGKVGGTGPFFAGSSAETEWASLHKVLALPDATRVFPGHDYYGGEGQMVSSTIGFERAHNPFLTVDGFAGFVHLKENWLAYKEEHGIR